jgi:predicted Fe-S protein YdhL (DUF1289 family)
MKAPAYLLEMPLRVLRGRAREIERWLKANDKQRPTLWDLHLARAARKGER